MNYLASNGQLRASLLRWSLFTVPLLFVLGFFSTRVAGGRGLGTILTGPALESIKAGNAYYGKASVLGTPYVGGYEPIKDASGAIIGVYFVGYKK